jgi:hypothetical protein
MSPISFLVGSADEQLAWLRAGGENKYLSSGLPAFGQDAFPGKTIMDSLG